MELTKRFTPRWSMLVKGGLYDGDSGGPDSARVWAQTTVSFWGSAAARVGGDQPSFNVAMSMTKR
jgi:hypothetical protein